MNGRKNDETEERKKQFSFASKWIRPTVGGIGDGLQMKCTWQTSRGRQLHSSDGGGGGDDETDEMGQGKLFKQHDVENVLLYADDAFSRARMCLC